MPSIEPTPEQVQALISAEHEGPVVMINLLRFKDHADGVDAADGISGEEAYQQRYGPGVLPHLERVGGRVLLAARAEQSVIGPADGEWDLVLAVEYPSRAAFVAMITDPEYLAVHAHRSAALADSRLIACSAALP
ncbi:MAG TPA: DUF1330 domain-containing protein [Solirubrobacteraceae bacterium]|jgi:uncharacterized protein (DUF1330 family)|nr:DUF1330 domain-containing protein [Solirubrobacteraceae bacterium]